MCAKAYQGYEPLLYDAGGICHLADLTVKAGMKALPVDIDQLFVDIFYYFQHSSKRKQEFYDLWSSLYTSYPENIVLLDGLTYSRVSIDTFLNMMH